MPTVDDTAEPPMGVPDALAQFNSSWPSMPCMTLLFRVTSLKNFSAVLRSLKVMSVDVGDVWMLVNSPTP